MSRDMTLSEAHQSLAPQEFAAWSQALGKKVLTDSSVAADYLLSQFVLIERSGGDFSVIGKKLERLRKKFAHWKSSSAKEHALAYELLLNRLFIKYSNTPGSSRALKYLEEMLQMQQALTDDPRELHGYFSTTYQLLEQILRRKGVAATATRLDALVLESRKEFACSGGERRYALLQGLQRYANFHLRLNQPDKAQKLWEEAASWLDTLWEEGALDEKQLYHETQKQCSFYAVISKPSAIVLAMEGLLDRLSSDYSRRDQLILEYAKAWSAAGYHKEAYELILERLYLLAQRFDEGMEIDALPYGLKLSSALYFFANANSVAHYDAAEKFYRDYLIRCGQDGESLLFDKQRVGLMMKLERWNEATATASKLLRSARSDFLKHGVRVWYELYETLQLAHLGQVLSDEKMERTTKASIRYLLQAGKHNDPERMHSIFNSLIASADTEKHGWQHWVLRMAIKFYRHSYLEDRDRWWSPLMESCFKLFEVLIDARDEEKVGKILATTESLLNLHEQSVALPLEEQLRYRKHLCECNLRCRRYGEAQRIARGLQALVDGLPWEDGQHQEVRLLLVKVWGETGALSEALETLDILERHSRVLDKWGLMLLWERATLYMK